MGAQSTVRRSLGRARGLMPLAAALLLAALLAIPASNIAQAQAPPGNELTLVNADREFVERKGGGEFVARPVFDREIANLFYAVRDADTGDWISAMYRVKGGEKKRSDGWEYSWEQRAHLAIELSLNRTADDPYLPALVQPPGNPARSRAGFPAQVRQHFQARNPARSRLDGPDHRPYPPDLAGKQQPGGLRVVDHHLRQRRGLVAVQPGPAAAPPIDADATVIREPRLRNQGRSATRSRLNPMISSLSVTVSLPSRVSW